MMRVLQTSTRNTSGKWRRRKKPMNRQQRPSTSSEIPGAPRFCQGKRSTRPLPYHGFRVRWRCRRDISLSVKPISIGSMHYPSLHPPRIIHPSNIQWSPVFFPLTDGPSRVAVAYSSMEFRGSTVDLPMYSFIWNTENPNKPEMTLRPPSSNVSLEYNPKVVFTTWWWRDKLHKEAQTIVISFHYVYSKDSHILIGGCYNGQLAFWDTRKGPMPVGLYLSVCQSP